MWRKCNIICKVEHLRKTGSQLGPLLSPRPLFKGQLSLHHLSLVIFIFWPWHFIFIPVPYLFIIYLWFILSLDPSIVKLYTYLCGCLHISLFFFCLFVCSVFYLPSVLFHIKVNHPTLFGHFIECSGQTNYQTVQWKPFWSSPEFCTFWNVWRRKY